MSPTSYQTAPPRTTILACGSPISSISGGSSSRFVVLSTALGSRRQPPPNLIHHVRGQKRLAQNREIVLFADRLFFRRQHGPRHHDHLQIRHVCFSCCASSTPLPSGSINRAAPRSAFASPRSSGPRWRSPPPAVPSPTPPSAAPETAADPGCRPPAAPSDAPPPALHRRPWPVASAIPRPAPISTRTRDPGSI